MKILIEKQTKATNKGFFNLFFKSMRTTFLIGLIGQLLSAITEIVFFWGLCGGTFPIVQSSNILPIFVCCLAVYLFEYLGVRIYLVKIIRQVVNKEFSSFASWVLFGFNLIFLIAICGSNIGTSIMGQTVFFEGAKNIKSTDKTHPLDSIRTNKIAEIERTYFVQDSIKTANHNLQVAALTKTGEKQVEDLYKSRYTVSKAANYNESKYNSYTRKIDKANEKLNDNIESISVMFKNEKLTALNQKIESIDRINKTFNKRVDDIENETSDTKNLYTFIQNNSLYMLIGFIILSWIAIIYEEIFYSGSGQKTVINEVNKRPFLMWVLLVGLYDKFYRLSYWIVTKIVGTVKYEYTAITQDLEVYDSKVLGNDNSLVVAKNERRMMGFNNDNSTKTDQNDNSVLKNTVIVNSSRTKNCKCCGSVFTYKNERKIYCSDKCRITAYNIRNNGKLKLK